MILSNDARYFYQVTGVLQHMIFGNHTTNMHVRLIFEACLLEELTEANEKSD